MKRKNHQQLWLWLCCYGSCCIICQLSCSCWSSLILVTLWSVPFHQSASFPPLGAITGLLTLHRHLTPWLHPATDSEPLPPRKDERRSPPLTLRAACSTLSGFASTPDRICLRGSWAWLLDGAVSWLLLYSMSQACQLAFCNRQDVICHCCSSLPSPHPKRMTSEAMKQELVVKIIIHIDIIWLSTNILAIFFWLLSQHLPSAFFVFEKYIHACLFMK